MPNPDAPQYYRADFDLQIREFIDQHRDMLAACLDGLTEEEARVRLVPSQTTLLGLVKHAAFVERVWFSEAPTGRSRADLGIPETPDDSFELSAEDTIDSVISDFSQACDNSRRAVLDADGDVTWEGNRRGSLSLRWIQLHVLREHAQHCGHADILREQVLARR
ncbi:MULTISPECIES: DinB family protein [Micrococcus]|uniref:DinB family protein n=1 Tax=Micrococcus antarcticus TaxID=86171 RepID=UPI00384D65FE